MEKRFQLCGCWFVFRENYPEKKKSEPGKCQEQSIEVSFQCRLPWRLHEIDHSMEQERSSKASAVIKQLEQPNGKELLAPAVVEQPDEADLRLLVLWFLLLAAHRDQLGHLLRLPGDLAGHHVGGHRLRQIKNIIWVVQRASVRLPNQWVHPSK